MRWLILVLLVGSGRAEEWDATNFPNPTAGQFRECKMKTTANICDPDGVLSEQARYRLDHDLKQLESRTRQDGARTFCDKKGVTAAMAVARHVKGGSTEAVKTMANDMLRRWTLDPQCQKAVVFVVSTDDQKFWVARDDKVPVYADEFTEIFMQQKTLFQQNNYQQALTNIMQKTWERALSKQGAPRPAPGGQGGGGGAPGPRPGFDGDRSGGGKGVGGMGGGGFKMPSIPAWVWLALIFIIIPLLCCCLCCYCCCCKGKGGGRAAAAGGGGMGDGGMGGGGMGGGGGGAPRAGGGGGSMFRNLAGGIGGAGIGSMIGNLISGRGGGAYPAAPGPIYDDNDGQGGGGLYPSKAVKDEGGGGSWG
ncbi:hypothetical protein NECAME_13646 [Necator americanus]|uniref:TPM domain-containing protein n=1 Tax=Necator americanus TaxID=51031 RepID=W2STF6_NECAM|nr:hypothetical protein NECAME_13646 [Necator americanus]ETN73039.1 hypothetical protein NECAME_13646 [Necator americanus]